MPRFHLESKKKNGSRTTCIVKRKELCVEISDVSGRGRGSCVGSGKQPRCWERGWAGMCSFATLRSHRSGRRCVEKWTSSLPSLFLSILYLLITLEPNNENNGFHSTIYELITLSNIQAHCTSISGNASRKLIS